MPKITVHGGPSDAAVPQEAVQDIDTGLLDEPTGKPAVNDQKAVWVAYAVSQGWSQDAAEKATKQQLIDTFKE